MERVSTGIEELDRKLSGGYPVKIFSTRQNYLGMTLNLTTKADSSPLKIYLRAAQKA